MPEVDNISFFEVRVWKFKPKCVINILHESRKCFNYVLFVNTWPLRDRENEKVSAFLKKKSRFHKMTESQGVMKTLFIFLVRIRKVCQLMTFPWNFALNKLCLGHKTMIYFLGDYFAARPQLDLSTATRFWTYCLCKSCINHWRIFFLHWIVATCFCGINPRP